MSWAASIRISGLRVVVDGANGAASSAAPRVYRELGAEVIEIHTAPDGYNINHNCGSTHLGDLQEAVVSEGAHVGIAHDGDADRCLAVDAEGAVVDGDQIMAVLAIGRKEAGALPGDTVVATVMSNLGFHLAMRDHGIAVEQTAVGDRYVLERMVDGGFTVGGEQSGHVLLLTRPPPATGFSPLPNFWAGWLRRAGRWRIGRGDEPTAPGSGQRPRRRPHRRRRQHHGDRGGRAGGRSAGRHRAGAARPSGTEPVIRVMVEAPSAEQAQEVADRLAHVVKTELALS